MSKVVKISEDHRYDLNNSCYAEVKIESTKVTKSRLRNSDGYTLRKSSKKLSKENKDLIHTDSEDKTLSDENFFKVKIKNEPVELTEPLSKSDLHNWTCDAEDQAPIFQSLCVSEIKIEPTELTECSWLKSSYTQASSKKNQVQTSPIESCNKFTNKGKHTPSSARSKREQALNVNNGDKVVKRKGNVSEEEKAEIMAYKEAGHNPRYIAKQIGRNLATVYKVFQIQRLHEAANLGKELYTEPQPKYNNGKKRRSPIDEKETALILKYKAAGFSIREIAKQIGRAHQNISKHLSRLK